MPEDYFSDLSSPSEAQSEPRQREDKDKDTKPREDEEQTALVPKAFFMGKNIEVDKKCEVKVVRIYDDEVEIKYVKHDKDKDKKKSAREESEDSMDSYTS